MKDSYPASKLSYLSERSEPRENAWERASEPREAEERRASNDLSKIFNCYFAQTKGNTTGWKMTFQKSKLIDNRHSWPALNFRGKCRNTMLLSPNPVSCRQSLNSLQKRRPAEEENRFLLLWELTECRLCVKFGPRGDHTGTEGSFQLSKQAGSFDVILAKLYVWKCWIANSILRAEDKSDWVCSSCGRKIGSLHQLYPQMESLLAG